MSILRSLLSYVPTLWQTGDVITAEKLNNIEDGIENASELYIVNFNANSQDYTISSDKEYTDILDAYNNGKLIAAKITSDSFTDVVCVMTPNTDPDTDEIVYFSALYSDFIISVSEEPDFTTTSFKSYSLVYSTDTIELILAVTYLTDEGGTLQYSGSGEDTYTNNVGD